MGKLTDDQWAVLWAEEMAGERRRDLALKNGIAVSTIASRARKEGRRKCDTGALSHRVRPPGGWPEDQPLPQSAVGMTPRRWGELLTRYQAGERAPDLAVEYGVTEGAIYSQAADKERRKKDSPDAVRLRTGPTPITTEILADGTILLTCADEGFSIDPDNPESTIATLTAQADANARLNRFPEVAKRLRMIGLLERVLLLSPWRRMNRAVDPLEDEAPSAIPLVLRTSQTPPASLPDGRRWSTWLFLGGRGAGKTLAGASWLADQAGALGPRGRLALIGPTLHDVREVMIEGVSGIRSLPRWTRATRPRFESSRRRLVFANGCLAYAFSAEDPDSLRGPQFSAAWADEFCAWPGAGPRGAAETLALLRMGLRLSGPDGQGPQLVVTTTPRPTRALVRLRDEATCAPTHAPTAENAAHLSPGFLDGLQALYGGTRRAAQELEGKVVELDGALFTAAMMDRARGPGTEWRVASDEWRDRRLDGEPPLGRQDDPATQGATTPRSSLITRHSPLPPFERIVVAIDPTTTTTGDACGIVAAGSFRRADGARAAVVLADRSIAGLGPDAWARRAVALAEEVGAKTIVAEVNQGGDMVKAVLKTAGCALRVREVRASKGKQVRAEPVAALYEQGRVHHAGAFDALEEELMAFGGEMEAAGSLDRADALVWAITDLLIDQPDGERGPRVRMG